jgi:uncharacterized protein
MGLNRRKFVSSFFWSALEQVYEKHNGKLLINSSSLFNVKNRALNIIGVDDLIGGNPNFQKSSENIDINIDSIVLNHCLEYSDSISELNKKLNLKIKMILSGHTHGGQITFLGKEFFKPKGSGNYLRGRYCINNLRMYISKNIGTSVLPFRLSSRAEATIFIFKFYFKECRAIRFPSVSFINPMKPCPPPISVFC